MDEDVSGRDCVRPLRGVHYNRDYGIWLYGVLEADHADHFVEPFFAEHHAFGIVSSDSGETVLSFCPRNRKSSGLEGTLRVSKVGALIAARWSYWNPAGNGESAGGEVVFAPPAAALGSAKLPALAATGLFWRKLRTGQYYQRWREYDRWILAAGDTLPHR